MREGWKQAPLGEVCQFINRGLAPKYLESGGVCVLNQKCVRNHAVDYSLGRRHDAAAKKVSPERVLKSGDVLVNSTGTGTLGRVAQVREEPLEITTVDSHVTIVRPLERLFHPEFFGYAPIAIEGQLQDAGEGCGGQTELARVKLANDFAVSYPTSIPEQQRIVAILDQAFDGIARAKANAEQNLKNARELFESIREDMLLPKDGWTTRPLGGLCEIKHGFAFKSEFFTSEGEYALLTTGNFYEKGGYRDLGDKQKYYVGDIPSGFILSEGDLLVAMTEQAAGLLGSPAIIPTEGTFLHNQRLGLVTAKPGVPWTNAFFFHVFNLNRVRKEIHGSASGVKVRHTSPGKIGEMRVSFPPDVAEQSAIAASLERTHGHIQSLESLNQQKLATLDELKKSLLHKAVSGGL